MKYIIRKTASMAVTVLIVSFLVFLAFSVIPGDPAVAKLGTSATPEKLVKLREELGLNRPLPVRYFEWIKSFLFGDMGTSYSYGVSVRSMLAGKLPITFCLTGMSFVLIIVISIPLGISAAKYEDTLFSKITDVLNQAVMAVPAFFTGILITYAAGLVLHLFTPGGYVSYRESMGGFLYYMLFPALAIALPKTAMNVRLLKSSVLKEAKLDYVRTAYSRGNSTNDVLYKHVLKNALIPVITFLGMTLSDIVAGSLIIEQVFSIPGIGRMLITSIGNRDYPVVGAIITIVAFIVIFINYIVDILYQVIDPRTRRQG
ncbi:MAG TPA: ABC transporter permease [Lachnospiraceae bacterium]|nr:ABC transporter permease [Lachnospiraceae bacterium]